MKAIVIVTPKKTVLDPQGLAIKNAIHHLGLECVTSVRMGKYLELEIAGSEDAARIRPKLEEISNDLLSNPVVEDYHLKIEATTKSRPTRRKKAAKKKK